MTQRTKSTRWMATRISEGGDQDGTYKVYRMVPAFGFHDPETRRTGLEEVLVSGISRAEAANWRDEENRKAV